MAPYLSIDIFSPLFELILRTKFQNFVFEDESRAAISNLENNNQNGFWCLEFFEKLFMEIRWALKCI